MDALNDRKNKLAIKIMVMPGGDDDASKEKELGEEGLPPALPEVDKPGMHAESSENVGDPTDPTSHPDAQQDVELIKQLLGGMQGRPGGLKDLVAKQAMKKSLNKDEIK